MKNDTRVFFVVDSLEANEELFETYGEAMDWLEKLEKDNHELIRMRVCLVNNAYHESTGWNYDDMSDTFTTIKIIKD